MAAIWHIYIIECANGALYTGITTDVERRFQAHLCGKGARYTRSHKAIRLVVSRPVGTKSLALRTELAIKRLPREEKINAILTSKAAEALEANLPNTRRNYRMNKSELVEAVATEAGISKAAAENVLSAVINTIVKTVAAGDTVALIGFGTFKSSQRAARTGKNPKTGEALQIAAATVPKFSAGATFKSAVSGK